MANNQRKSNVIYICEISKLPPKYGEVENIKEKGLIEKEPKEQDKQSFFLQKKQEAKIKFAYYNKTKSNNAIIKEHNKLKLISHNNKGR